MEIICQRSLARELPAHGLEFNREVWIDVCYKGEKVGKKRVDFVIGTSATTLAVMLDQYRLGLMRPDLISHGLQQLAQPRRDVA